MRTRLLKFLLVSCLFFFGVKNAEAATITTASLTTTAGTIGLAANPLNSNRTGIAVLGVSLHSNAFANNNVTKFTFTSTAAITPYFSNFKLYSSTNASYTAGTDPIVPSTFTVVGSTISITPTTTQAINGGFGGLTVYYFLIADFTQIGGPSNVTGSFSLTGLTGPGTTTGTPCAGPTYTCVPLPPPILNYVTPNPTYVVTGAAITPNNLNNTGGAIVGNYSITIGTLPAGLSFNATNGQITGTPTTATAGAVAITVSGTNASGTATTTVNITVNNAPPPILNYANANPTYIIDGTSVTDNLNNTGGAVVGNYTITSGTLPGGLNFNPANGQISGTPTTPTAGAVAITVSGTNSGGTATTTVNITVNNAPPPILNYADANPTYIAGTAITPDNLTNTGGAIVGNYSITSGTLPAGLSFTASTGQISGTPTAATAGAIAITVSGTNSGGTVSTIVNITVNTPPAPVFTYNTPDVFVVGTAIATQNPTNTGGPVNTYSISPGLPAGLNFNTSTGAITGNPTTVTAAANYVVTGNNPGGSSTFTINITVNPKLPALTYTTPNVYTTGVAITPLNPNNTGGAVDSYAISPALPAGLGINTLTGVISGTPTGTATAAVYQVTATNVTGNGTFNITITVNPPKPVITYTTPQTYQVGTAITTLSPTNTGGPIVSYAVAPALPGGLTLNTSTGDITGTPTTATGAANYTVTATNAGGPGTFVINITVLPKPPAFTYTNPAAITYGSALPNITPTNTGAAATSCTISPTGTGVVVSATGVVSGTPNNAGTITYTITPTNAGGTGPGATVTITVNQKTLTVTGTTVTTKVYDGNTTATLTGGTLVGKVTGDVVNLVPSGTFNTADVGINKPVTSTSTLSGADATNYILVQPTGLTGRITAKNLTITGLTANNKVYDGTTTATFTAGTLVGVVAGDVVTLTTTGTFNNKNIGTGKAITNTSTLGGADAGNYTVTQITGLTATITAKNLTITGLQANDKVYDGTTTATFSGGTLVGVVAGDAITLSTTGTFATKNVGTNIAVANTSTLNGTGNGNYTLTQITGLSADITPKALNIRADDQTRDVGITIAYTATYTGFVTGEDSGDLTTLPTITSTATAASGPGTYPITAAGAVDNNYTITYTGGTLTITSPGTHTAYIWDWTGTVNTAWENPLNWSINNVQQTASYPGSATNKDKVQIGVDILYPAAKSPVISATSSINLITFGTDNATQIGLTVNGTLNTTADITLQVDNNIFAGSLTINLSGSGTVNVPNLNVVNNQTALSFETANFNSSVAHLNVAGNISLTTAAFILAGINSKFTLTGGITTVGGILKTTNNAVIFATTNSTFAIIPTVPANGAILNLTNANAINLDNNTSVLDFDHVGSFVNYTGSANPQTVYTSSTPNASTGLKYQNLTISGTGTGVPATGTLTVDKDMITSGATNFGTNAPTVNVAGNWTNTANVNQGGANITVSTQLINNSNTITGGAGFLTTGAMLLTGGAINAAGGTVTDNGVYLNNGGAFNCGAGSVIFKGSYTNNTGTFGASTGMVYFSGAGQAMQDNSPTGTVFNNVTFNGTGNTAIAAGTGGAGNFAVSAIGTLTMGTGSKLTAGPGGSGPGYLTLMSDPTSTARIDIIPTGASIVGSTNVQRYLSGGNVNYRGYRLLSSPVNISGVTNGTGNLGMAYLNTDASFGGTTYHGSFTQGPGTGFTLNGSTNPIIYLYDESKNTDNRSFTGGKNIGIFNIYPGFVTTLTGVTQASAFIPVGNSYLLYYVGDNTSTSVAATRVPENTRITATGYINQGDVPVKFWNTGLTEIPYHATIDVRTGLPVPIFGLNQVGNPYASTISLDSVYFDNKTSISPVFWELKEPGQTYVSFNAATHTSSGSGASAYILSGQGFLAAATGTGKTLTFHEKQKVNQQLVPPNMVLSLPKNPSLPNTSDTPANASLASLLPEAASTPAPVNTLESQLKGLHLQLSKDSVNYTQTGIYFSNKWTDTYKLKDDAVDLDGTSPKVYFSSYSSDGKRLSINQLGDVIKSKRIKLYAGVTSTGPYTISLADIANMDTNMYHIYLVDNNLKDSVDMLQNRSYAFTINNSDTSTWGANRFVLVIERLALPPYKLVNFSGQKVDNGVSLSWKTMNEGNYTGFVLQKLVSGNNYTALYTTQSTGAGLYSYVDQHPVNGDNTYRLQQTGPNGKITYSALVTVNYKIKTLPNGLTVYPNPSSSIINISLVSNILSKPNYIVDIYNTSGKVMSHKNVNTDTWKQDISSYRLGIYIIEIKTNSGYLVGKSKFVKVN